MSQHDEVKLPELIATEDDNRNCEVECDLATNGAEEAGLEFCLNWKIRERQLRSAIAQIAMLTAQAEELGEQSEGWYKATEAAEAKIDALRVVINSPETEDFFVGIELEAAHQRARWPSEQDAGKTPADWFWLVGYLAGKCLHAAIGGDREKALHHTISTAAALANWHRAIKGAGNMRPGIAEPRECILDTTGDPDATS